VLLPPVAGAVVRSFPLMVMPVRPITRFRASVSPLESTCPAPEMVT